MFGEKDFDIAASFNIVPTKQMCIRDSSLTSSALGDKIKVKSRNLYCWEVRPMICFKVKLPNLIICLLYTSRCV